MKNHLTRRNFLSTATTATLAGSITPIAAAVEGTEGKSLKIQGVACSPRRGMTTAKPVQAALDAAKSVDERIEVELIDFGGLNIAGWSPAPTEDDFNTLLPKLQDPAVAGIIIGSPSYFRGPTSLCFGMIAFGGRPPAFLGGTQLATKDGISGDELGLTTARNTGLRLVDLALKLTV